MRDVAMFARPMAAPSASVLWAPPSSMPRFGAHGARGGAVSHALRSSRQYSRSSIFLQQEDGPEEDEEFLAEIEDVLSDSRSPGVDPGLRIQRAIGRRNRERNVGFRTERPRGEPRRYTRESTQLFRLPRTLAGAYNDFLERPGQPLVLGALMLLFGFYLAGALSTIFGAAGFWEPTIALGPLTVTELISRRYYSRPLEQRSQTIRLLNALKVGFYLGIVIDALKLAG